jgi:hypothetical protein
MLSNKMQNGSLTNSSLTGMKKIFKKTYQFFWKKAHCTQLGYGKGSVAEP